MGHIRVESRTQVTNTVEKISWKVESLTMKESDVDSLVPWTHHDPRDLGLICLVKKGKIRFWILSDLGIQFWIFLKKRTLRTQFSNC